MRRQVTVVPVDCNNGDEIDQEKAMEEVQSGLVQPSAALSLGPDLDNLDRLPHSSSADQ